MDRLQRGIDVDKNVRVVAAVTTDLTREACRRHEIGGAEAVILGRALTAGCLLATLTKHDEERVRIAVRADGPAGRVLIDARGDGGVRGCLEKRLEERQEPGREGGRMSIAHVVGSGGQIVVTRDVGLEQEYQGVVEITTGEIDSDLERYLGTSEQLPSAMACEVLLDARSDVLRCAGVLCQTFPGGDGERLERIRNNLYSGAFADLLRQDRSTREIMGFALLGTEFEAMDESPLEFRCTCGRDRALSVVSTLGADDVENLANEPGETDVRCSYCGRTYTLAPEELLSLASRLRRERS